MGDVIDLAGKKKEKENKKELLAMQELSKELDRLIVERINQYLGVKSTKQQIDPRLVAILFADRLGNLMGAMAGLGLDENTCLTTLRKCDEIMLRTYYTVKCKK